MNPKPNKKDRSILMGLISSIDKIMDEYQNLNRETKHFLCTEFVDETELQLRRFKQNIKDTIEEVEK